MKWYWKMLIAMACGAGIYGITYLTSLYPDLVNIFGSANALLVGICYYFAGIKVSSS
jgi:hypothetical protein